MSTTAASKKNENHSLEGIEKLLAYVREGLKDPDWTHPVPTEEQYRSADRLVYLQQILDNCKDAECLVCGWLCCPTHTPDHFDKDGCPSCSRYEEYGQ